MLMPQFLLAGEFSAFEPLLLKRFHNVKHFAAGDTIIQMNADRSKNCYYVLDGVASYIMRHEDGGAKISSLRGKGTIFPLYYTYGSTNMESSLDVVAVSDLMTLDIPKKELMQLIIEIPQFGISMCDAWGKYATLLLYDVSSQLFDSASIRICSFLYIQHFSSGQQITMTHEEIGLATGVTRATVSRVLGALAKDGIITIKRNCVRIVSLNRLLEHCSYVTSPSHNPTNYSGEVSGN